jgi:hypothetical protein
VPSCPGWCRGLALVSWYRHLMAVGAEHGFLDASLNKGLDPALVKCFRQLSRCSSEQGVLDASCNEAHNILGTGALSDERTALVQ